jgi:uncharacterized circularly permuted ATP-grasp superfamily protein
MNKENNMICTGAIPPQLVMGLELYQAYMSGVFYWYKLYANLIGMDYWTRYLEAYQACVPQ